MSKLGAAIRRTPEREDPTVPIAPVKVYMIELDGPGWRASVYEVPVDVLVKHGRRLATREPEVKMLAIDWIGRQLEDHSR